jgi:magnesium-transporting ATPase (P-type)
LSSEEARSRLQKIGPNAMSDTALHPLRRALGNFWAPVPWMLEATIVLELVLGKYVEAAVIGALLVFNAALGLFQESRAQATLAALKSRLALNASVRRDGAWKTIPATLLVPGDLVKLSLGRVVAAALGARALAKQGVLPTRLSAVDEVGMADVLALAALASSDGGQDPVDGAIRAVAASKKVSDAPRLVKFVPFDPAKKMSEATATDPAGAAQRIVKAAAAAAAAAKELEGQGYRVLAVAAGAPTALKLAGLIALSDLDLVKVPAFVRLGTAQNPLVNPPRAAAPCSSRRQALQ